MIISKKTDKQSQQPLTYIAPFDQFVNISNNLIKAEKKGSLIANAPDSEEYEYKSEQLIWSWMSDDNNPPLMDYTRLGLSADFQSWLEEDTLFGHYGLKLKVYGYRKTATDKEKNEAVLYELELNERDMYGNPYDYPTYFTQEKLFDIAEIYCIHKMELFFYEKPESFFLKDGKTALDYQDFLGNYINPNLYVRDIQVAVGYDVSEFEDEMLLLYTFNTETYESTQTDEQNTKQIHVRWIHEDENGNYVSIDEKKAKDLDYTLTFYRYELGHGSADDYSGVYWKELSVHKHIAENNIFENKYSADCGLVPTDKQPGNLDTWFIPDISLQTEQIKAILRFNNKIYRSKILEFKNNKDVKSKATLEALEALTIRCTDNSYGNYYIYTLGNRLLNEADAALTREFRAYFDLEFATKVETDLSILTEAEEVEWIIPKGSNTMIKIDEGYRKPDKEDIDGYHFIWNGSLSNPATSDNGFKVDYRIDSYFSQYRGNNTIQLNITKGGVKYSTSKTLSFGPAGTTGTDHTLVLDFDKNINALTTGDTDIVTVTARLYNFQNQEVDISNRAIKWAWKGYTSTQTAQMKYEVDTVQKNKVNINLLSTNIKPDNSNYSILQCTLEKWVNDDQNGWGDYDLVAYLPIPIRSSNEYRHIIGPTTVIYNSDGIADNFYRDAYALRKKDGTDYYDKWEIFSGRDSESDNDKAFRPTITKAKTKTADGNDVTGYFLNPSNLYTEEACDQLCICGYSGSNIIWSQPLLILQNRWPVAMLNEWDGRLKIDEENNTILAARIAAGKKEKDDNTFTGVMMGDWNDGSKNEKNELVKYTGLAGYHHGAMSFAFVNNGTAFIGKQGRGRIQFDGNNGTITSGNYVKNQSGMLIDLDDAIIDAYDFQLKSKHVFIDSATTNGNDESNARNVYFQIKDSDANNLVYISENSYYLQSSNFISGTIDKPGEGMKIDLDDGRIDAYTFKLVSKNLTINSTADATTFLTVRDNSGNVLINAGTNNFYLQSDDYADGSGMRIDLETGKITAYSFYLHAPNLTIDSDGSPYYLDVGTNENHIRLSSTGLSLKATNNVTLGAGDNLIQLSDSKLTIRVDNAFYLKATGLLIDSANPTFYIGDTDSYTAGTTSNYIYFNASGFNIKVTKNIQIGSANNYISISETEGTIAIRATEGVHLGSDTNYLKVTTENNVSKISIATNIFNLTTNKLAIDSATPMFYIGNTDAFDTNSTTSCIYFNGTDLDIRATTFKLTAGTTPNNLILTSNTTAECPLQIGDNFKVAWDGTITASNANLTGEINADSGRIGYWNIQTGDAVNYTGTYSRLWTAGGSYITSLYSEYPHTEASYRFVIVPGKTASSDGLIEGTPTFYIRKDGYLYATSGQIAGINFTSAGLGTQVQNTNVTASYVYPISMGSQAGYFKSLSANTIFLNQTGTNYISALNTIVFNGANYTLYQVLKDYHTLEDIYAILA